MRIITSEVIDAATLSASPAAASDWPVTNLQRATRGDKWRSTSAAVQNILGNLNDAENISGLALTHHNLKPGALARLYLYDGLNQTGNTLYDSGDVDVLDAVPLGDIDWARGPLSPHLFSDWDGELQFWAHWLDSVTGAQSFKLKLDDTANSDGHLQAGRLYLGSTIETKYGPASELPIGWKNLDKQYGRTDAGSLRTERGARFRKMTLELRRLEQNDRSLIMELQRWAGKTYDFFISVFPGNGTTIERDYAFPAKFVSDADITATTLRAFKNRLDVEEI